MTNAEPSDAEFGRAAQAKEEEADRLVAEGKDPEQHPEEGRPPKAGGKAEDASSRPEEESEQSFPASDPPTGS